MAIGCGVGVAKLKCGGGAMGWGGARAVSCCDCIGGVEKANALWKRKMLSYDIQTSSTEMYYIDSCRVMIG